MGEILGPVSVTLSLDQREYRYEMTADTWQELVAPISAEGDPGQVLCRIRVEHARSPKELGVNVDDRNLGVMVRRIYLR